MLHVIEGGGEVHKPEIKPQLVKDEHGRVCMQCTLGPYSATLVLPEQLIGASEERLQKFFDAIVPEMSERLHAMRRKDERKFRRKALKKC